MVTSSLTSSHILYVIIVNQHSSRKRSFISIVRRSTKRVSFATGLHFYPQRFSKPRRQGVSLQYFKDYSHLETHFRRKHFLCEDNLCKQLKFVVFSSQFELQAHNVSVHYGMRLNHLIRVTQLDKMTKEQKALARTVEVNFTVRRERDPSPTRSTDSTALSFAHHDVGPVKPATPIAVAKNPEELTREERTRYAKKSARIFKFRSFFFFFRILTFKSRNVALRKKIMVFLKNDNQRFVNFSHQSKSFLDGNTSANGFYLLFVSLFGDDAAGRVSRYLYF